MSAAPRLYFVSIREHDVNGHTVCAAHFEAATIEEARLAAIKEFERPAVPDARSLPSEIEFCRLVNETRARVLKNGYVVMARLSKADRGNAVNSVCPEARA